MVAHAEFGYIVGSFGTEKFREDSDIDLAIYFKKHGDQEKIFKLKWSIEDLTKREVDLVDLRKIDPIFAYQVLKTGRLLIDRDHLLRTQWQTQMLGQYFDFKIDRIGIEKRLLIKRTFPHG